MPYIPKFLIPFFLIFFIYTTSVAQVGTSFLNITDSCITYLNRIENIKSIQSQIGIVGKDQLRFGYSLNLLNALQGKINGVGTKTSTSGNSPSSVFFMRGERNLMSSSQPLYVVDGIPIIGQLTSYLGIDLGNLVNDWNMDEIESVTVLKGGQAASLYGNRAGNGAILIQTKIADNKGFHVDYYSAVVLRQIADYPDFQNKYGQGFDGQFSYENGIGGGIYDDQDGSWGPQLNGQLITQFDGPSSGWINGQVAPVRGGDTWARNQAANNGTVNSIEATPWIAQPDNVKDYFQSAWTFANNLSLSWADCQGGIRISYSNVRAEFVIPNTQYVRNTLGGNFTYTFFKKLTFFGSFQNTHLNDKNVLTTDGPNYDNPMKYFAWMGRQVNINSLKKYWQAGQENLQQYRYEKRYWDNPWFVAYENSSPVKRNNSFGTYGIKFDLAKGLSMNCLGGFNTVDARNERYKSPADINKSAQLSGYETNTQGSSRNSFYVDYNFRISKKNAFNSFAGIYFEKNKSLDIYKLSLAVSGESESQINSKGYYGGISYIWNNAVSARFALSGDTYKSVTTAKTPGFYSLSSGIEFEELFRLPELISKLSFQSGISSTGLNTIAGYSSNIYLSAEESRFSTLSEYTMGLDIGFHNNRALLNVNYYDSKTQNGLMMVPIATGSGYSSIMISSSSVRNSGYELNLSLVPVKSWKLVWNSIFSFYKNKNEVLTLAEGINKMQNFSKTVIMGNEVGSPTGNLYGRKLDRFEGQIIYLNGKPVSNNSQQLLGNVNPDFIILFTNSIDIRRFTFSMAIEYSNGGESFSNFMNMATAAGTLSNTADRENGFVGEGVKWDGTSGTYVKNDVNISVQDYYSSTIAIQEYFITDATYLKLRDLNLAYNFKIRQKLNLTCSIFGHNIFTWSKSSDYNNGNLVFDNIMFYRGLNNYNLPETYELGMKMQVHI